MVYSLEWWIVLLAAAPLYIVVCTFHEVAHGVVLAFYGWKFEITPWPTKRDGKWYFGLCEWKEFGDDPPWWIWNLSHVAPRLPNVLFITISYIWYHYLPMGEIASTIVALLGIFSFVDCCVGLLPIWRFKERPDTDIWKFQKGTEINIWILRIICLVIVILLAIPIFKPA